MTPMDCFTCGGQDLIITPDFDLHCTGKATTRIECMNCGAEWFDDTYISDDELQTFMDEESARTEALKSGASNVIPINR